MSSLPRSDASLVRSALRGAGAVVVRRVAPPGRHLGQVRRVLALREGHAVRTVRAVERGLEIVVEREIRVPERLVGQHPGAPQTRGDFPVAARAREQVLARVPKVFAEQII